MKDKILRSVNICSTYKSRKKMPPSRQGWPQPTRLALDIWPTLQLFQKKIRLQILKFYISDEMPNENVASVAYVL